MRIIPQYFFRNARSGELLELFLVSAISSLLFVRFYLELTGYPKIGGDKLHIAHMLPGGLLMVAGLVLMMAFLGSRVQRIASVAAGAGFGLFIDEIGKFITKDNNYFFQPTIAIIYIIFVLLFLAFRSLNRSRLLNRRENLLNAISMLEEMAMNDLDAAERQRALGFLRDADVASPLVQSLRVVLEDTTPLPVDQGDFLLRWKRQIEDWYRQLISSKLGVRVIDWVFVGKALIFIIVSVLQVVSLLHGNKPEAVFISLFKFASSLVAFGFVVAGVIKIRSSRLQAYELLTKSLLIDIFVTQFFSFYGNQFGALPGFILNVALYIALRFIVRQERHIVLDEEASA